MAALIYEAISNVMADVGAIGKDSTNQQQKFKYRGIDAVMNGLNPALVKHKVFVAPEVLEQTREERTTKSGAVLIYSICKIKFKFYTTDGSSVEVITIGEGMDSGDKATNKAMSIAFKYACFQLFCIPTEEMIDPDGEIHEPAPKREQKPKKDNAVREAELRTKILAYVNRHSDVFNAEAIEKLCARYQVRKIQDMSLEACENYIRMVKEKGGNIDE